MEVAPERIPHDELGPRIAAGRDMVVRAYGDDRVARQAEDARDRLGSWRRRPLARPPQ